MNAYPYISRNIIYPLYERITGRQFLDKLAFLEASQWWSREKLLDYQWQKFKKLLAFAFQNNAFYRKRFQEAGLHPDHITDFSQLCKLPILTKAEIVENLPLMISEGCSDQTLLRDQTSGSTGRNLIFYNDRNTLDWMAAAVLRNMAWYDVNFGDKRFKLWGSLANESPQERLFMWLRNLCLREYLISSYQLDSRRIPEIVKQLQQQRPKALIGYVSALEILGNYIERENIPAVAIPAVIPAAETLFDHQRALFQRVFQAEVFNRYGCHEFTAIAHECNQHKGMHVNAECVLVEVVKNDHLAGSGEIGEIVVTDLENFGFPFIRYRMEDLGSLTTTECPCGRGLPILEEVQGRVYDLITCPNGTTQTGTFFCKMTRSVDGIREFQVIQEARAKLRFKLVTDQTFSVHSVEFLKNQIKAHCGDEMKLEFEYVREIAPLKSGKRRYVVALNNSPNNSEFG